jgi:hypothetical protein
MASCSEQTVFRQNPNLTLGLSVKNFKSSVPSTLSSKIKAFAESVDFSETVAGNKRYGFEGEQRLSEIEGNYVSGWMPRQDGGFQISQWVQNDIDTSYHFTDKQTEFNNEQSEDCRKAFCMDNGLDIDTKWEDLGEDLEEQYSEYERDWFESALLTLEIFCNGYSETFPEKEQTVIIRLAINYKDAPYYREKYAEDIKEIILTVEEFMNTENEEIIKEFTI